MLFARIPLYDENGMDVPGYLEIDARKLAAKFSDFNSANPTVKIVLLDKTE
jgi:hypothetical protein